MPKITKEVLIKSVAEEFGVDTKDVVIKEFEVKGNKYALTLQYVL